MTFKRRAVNKDIIEENQHKLMKIILENIIHKALKDRGGIGETKGHYQKFVVVVVCSKGGFRYDFFVHSYLIIPGSKVQFCEDLCSLSSSNSSITGIGYLFLMVMPLRAQ